MQEEYNGTLLEDGHVSIPKEIIDKLKIDKGSRLRVIVKVEKGISKKKILSYGEADGLRTHPDRATR